MNRQLITIIKTSLLLILFFPASYSQNLSEIYFRDAMKCYQRGDYENAYIYFETYAENEIIHKEYYLYYALTCLKLKLTGVTDILKAGIQKYPGYAELHSILIRLYAEQGDFYSALQVLEQIKYKIDRGEYARFRAHLLFNEGVKLYNQDSLSDSENYFRKARRLLPEQNMFVRNHAIVLWKLNRRDEAVALLESSVQKFPDDAEMNDLLIRFYEKTRDVDGLKNKLEERAKSGTLEDNLVLAQFYQRTLNIPRMKAAYTFLEKKFPKEKQVYLSQADFWRKQGKYPQADSVYMRMEKVFPADTLVFKARALNFKKMDSLHQANLYWKKCIGLFPTEMDFYYPYLNNLQALDATAYLKALDSTEHKLLYPRDWFRVGKRWFDAGHFRRALSCFQQVEEYVPNSLLLQYVALSQKFLGLDSLAKTKFEQAVQAPDPEPRPYFELARYFKQDSILMAANLEIGMEVLLARIKANQEASLNQLNQGWQEPLNTQSTFSEAPENYSLLLEKEIEWIMVNLEHEAAMNFISGLFHRFPKNHYLRIALAEMHLKKNEYAVALNYLNDALFIKPGNIKALKNKIFLLKQLKSDEELYQSYLVLFHEDRTQLSHEDFTDMIHLSRRQRQLDNLCAQWMVMFEKYPEDELLKRFLTEALHISGKHKEARKIASHSVEQKAEIDTPAQLTPLKLGKMQKTGQ